MSDRGQASDASDGKGENASAFDLAIMHLTFEGIQTYGGGVATVTRGHIGALPRIKEVLATRGISLTPYFAEIAYLPSHERSDPDYQKKAEKAISDMGGRIEYLVNLTQGTLPKAPWGVGDLGGMENWKTACASGAGLALNIAKKHRVTVVYCHDSLFALAPVYASLQEDAFRTDARLIYVIHATALTHELPLPNPERLMVESVAVHWAKVTPKVKLGYISEFMTRHITNDYGAKADQFVPTGNGINPDDPYFRTRERDHIVRKLEQYGVPTDRPLVFSWGRAVAYKKYDVFLESCARLKGKVHPVVMLTPEYPELVELSHRLDLDTTFVFAFDPELAACMLQWEKTLAAASLAYLEPFGLTPVEVRMMARKQGALMVVSNTGGLVEQVTDSMDGFVTRQDDPEDVARVFQVIQGMSAREKDTIRTAGLETVLGKYTWSSQILNTLAAIVPEKESVFVDARRSLAQETLSKL